LSHFVKTLKQVLSGVRENITLEPPGYWDNPVTGKPVKWYRGVAIEPLEDPPAIKREKERDSEINR